VKDTCSSLTAGSRARSTSRRAASGRPRSDQELGLARPFALHLDSSARGAQSDLGERWPQLKRGGR
jgi:hypothetical protein